MFGIASVIIANNKGFRPLRWLFSFEAIGLGIAASLDGANEIGISPSEQQGRREKADLIGAILAGFQFFLMLLIFILWVVF